MSGLATNEMIHMARISIYPPWEGGRAGWAFSTVRYTHGGRVPQIVTQQSGLLLVPPAMSEWGCAEALYSVVQEILGVHPSA